MHLANQLNRQNPDDNNAMSFSCPVFEWEGSMYVLLPNSRYLFAESCVSFNSKCESLFTLPFFNASSANDNKGNCLFVKIPF